MTGYKSNPLFTVSDLSSSGFHLQPYKNTYDSSKDTISSSIIFKQRIDAMFSDTSSMISTSRTDIGRTNGYYNDTKARRAISLINGNGVHTMLENNNKTVVKNMVQTQIERMFADVETSESDTGDNHKSMIENFSFSVDYLGSLPLADKVTTLEGLQKPLKNLYFKYKQSGKDNQHLKDSLSISNSGLKVLHYSKNHDLAVQVNPFPTIAVWAAIKFVCRPRGLGHGKEFGLEYAFMPLIADAESTDKVTLFQKVSSNEVPYFSVDSYDDHTPLFAVVMRKTGISRQLECHGFVCKSSEEAILMAANLYKTLLNSVGKNPSKHSSNKKRPNIRHKNGLSSVSRSIGGSSIGGDSEFIPSNIIRRNSIFYRSGRNKAPPIRPPRRIKPRNKVLENIHGEHIIPRSNDITDLGRQNYNFRNSEIGQYNDRRMHGNQFSRLTRSKSMRQKNDGLERGDILTKIAIPHSRSFLNAGGPISSRYSRRSSGCPTAGGNALCRKNSLGSPLGLNELFNEFQLQEGLNNIEDILAAIVDSDGMSFNDLKPIYKEFLLKLAVTLTKDELYQRSKAIMHRQKNRKKEMLRRNSCKLKKTFTAAGGLRKAFRKSVSKLKSSQKKTSNFTSILFPSCGNLPSNQSTLKSNHMSPFNFSYKMPSSKLNSQTGNRKQRNRKTPEETDQIYLESLRRKINSRKYLIQNQEISQQNSVPRRVLQEQDLFSLLQHDKNEAKHKKQGSKVICQDKCLNTPSSEYFTCSECSHDSESCTCISIDKCYCSIVENKNNEQIQHINNNKEENNLSLSSCSCDTDSCFESEKCYCNQETHPSVFEQLKQQGFAASESSLSRANSPTTAWQKNDTKTQHEVRTSKSSKVGLQPSKSLEFLRIQRHPLTPTGPFWNQNDYYKRYDTFDSEIEQYDDFSRRRSESVTHQPQFEYHSSSSNSLSSKKRSSSSDNLAVDYNMFKHHNKTNNNNKINKDKEQEQEQERKVLVVSAHDPKGRVLYMGASCHSDSITNSASPLQNNDQDRTDVMSIKKSAEIAALFSSTKPNSSSSGDKEDVIYNTLEPPDYLLIKGSSSGSQYLKSANLENSLGYFP